MFHPAPVSVTNPIPNLNWVIKIAPIIIIVNPSAAHRVRKPISTANAPSGSTIESSFVVNSMNEDNGIGGGSDQNGNL